MKTFLITYTLDSFDELYPIISEKIQSYPKWARISQYAWLIQTEEKAPDIRNDLKTSIVDRGSIFVIDVSSSAWATFAVSRNVTNWMKENI